MENINLILARNMKLIREQRKLSLDKVAELSGISKTMLGQIERGESNPSIATVWKIANGLKISFTTLIDEPKSDTTVLMKEHIKVLQEDEGRIRIYPHFSFEEGRRFEMYMMEMDEQASLSAEPHVEGAEEFITVCKGEVTIRVGEAEHTLRQGDSIRFKADQSHTYFNPGRSTNQLSMVIYYAGHKH
ncbi:helix-turn-helix transcriptional regulator [Paenibacillus barcinonensis]|uniref:Helix-turn-helix transcriptional regulator n=1 Tax=Paenibacillus barcinonensis TaxID=198119 RepID=A0A2V4VBB4_PAEBA|nr:XRE family transcriptional regulator [Paenibacillus barcinonensis]PYE50312.1 XRE family transcriptional regulator [Paenibacillus barcinonensis]QKS54991.1 helix-turn-helix transcriptional regulator [Paenibacillus barcinonensis]